MAKKQRKVKAKFAEQRESLPPILPKNENQNTALQALYNPSVNVVILDGFAGTGKTYLAGSVAADLYRRNYLDKIVVSRPYVQTGRTTGLKPGTVLDKMFPYVRNILDPIKTRMGAGAFDVALKDGISGAIEIQEVESIRGRSFDDPSFLIIDEAQQTTREEMESIVTRVGENCKLVLCGDWRQKDIKQESGMEWFIDFAARHNLPGVAHIQFGIDDCVRSGFVRDVLIGIEKDKGNTVFVENC